MKYVDCDWWNPEKDKTHDAVFRVINGIKQNEGNRQMLDVQNARLYGEHTVFGYEFKGVPNSTRLTMNVIKAVTDTVVARVARNRPRPVFLTSGGNWSLRRKARLLGQFVEYALYSGRASDALQGGFLDAAVLGTGAVQPYIEGKKVKFDRVFPCELFVDPTDGMYGRPRSLYRRKWVNRDHLLKQYPDDHASILTAAGPAPGDTTIGIDTDADLVTVIEAWHLPSQEGKSDGYHAICTDKGCLLEETWSHDRFPIIFMHYSRGLFGFWGKGIAENLTGIQVELNKNLIKRQKILHLMAVPRVLLDGALTEGKGHTWNNAIGGVFRHNGAKPVIYAPATVPPELNGYIQDLWQKAFQMEGVSPLEATGQKPAGIESGIALREYDDLLSGKFSLTHQMYEQAWMDASWWCVALGKEIAKKHPKWSLVGQKDKRTIQEIKWADVDMTEDEYVLKVFPASSLPRTPGGRLSMVGDMFDKQWIDADQAKRLLDFPDLESEMSLDRAGTDYLDWAIEMMLDEGERIAPEPFQDHALALKRVNAAYHKAVCDGAPEDNLSLLRDFMRDTRDLLKQMQAEQAALMAPPAPGAPAATGFEGAPPTAVTPEDGTIPQ